MNHNLFKHTNKAEYFIQIISYHYCILSCWCSMQSNYFLRQTKDWKWNHQTPAAIYKIKDLYKRGQAFGKFMFVRGHKFWLTSHLFKRPDFTNIIIQKVATGQLPKRNSAKSGGTSEFTMITIYQINDNDLCYLC